MPQNPISAGSRLGELTALPRIPYLDFRGLLLTEREGGERIYERKGREGRKWGNGKEWKGSRNLLVRGGDLKGEEKWGKERREEGGRKGGRTSPTNKKAFPYPCF